jgi:hypothetical protein
VVESQTIQGKHLSFKRVLALFLKTLLWSFTALFIVLVTSCIVELNPRLKRAIYGPDHLASITLEPEGLTVAIELTNASPIGKAEYERRLIVVTPNGTQETSNLEFDQGGFPSSNLYRTMDGKFVLAGALDAKLISPTPLRVTDYSESYLSNRDKGLYGQTDLRGKPFKKENKKRLGPLFESNYFSRLFYVGTFELQPVRTANSRQKWDWSFIPASEQKEDFIRDPGG